MAARLHLDLLVEVLVANWTLPLRLLSLRRFTALHHILEANLPSRQRSRWSLRKVERKPPLALPPPAHLQLNANADILPHARQAMLDDRLLDVEPQILLAQDAQPVLQHLLRNAVRELALDSGPFPAAIVAGEVPDGSDDVLDLPGLVVDCAAGAELVLGGLWEVGAADGGDPAVS